MEVIQENKVFLLRNEELLLFKHNEEYDGDDVNVEDYTNENFLRYIAVKKKGDSIKQIFYYFANTTDQYLTQSGKWIKIEKARNYPVRPLTSAVLKHYISEGRFDSAVRVGVKNGDEVFFTEVTA